MVLKYFYLLMLALSIFASGLYPAFGQHKNCKLQRVSDTAFSGFCKMTDTSQLIIQLRPPAKNEINIWRGRGTFPKATSEIPVFLEVRSDSGTFGSRSGWYEVSNIESHGTTLEFAINMSQKTPATSKDLEILRRARAYLSDTTKWSRQDNRTFGYIDCHPQAVKRTLFCAIYYAQLDILGDNYGGLYYNEVLQAIRRLRYDQHPVQAFNNDPSTTLTDIQSLLDDAINHIKQNLSLQKSK